MKSKNNYNLTSLDVSARDFKYKYLIEQSYTLLDYQFYQQFIQPNERKLLKLLKQISSDNIQRLAHNIFPDGSTTLLHFIAGSNLGFEAVDYIGKLSKKEGFVIPFLINADQMTPLDLTVQRKDFK